MACTSVEEKSSECRLCGVMMRPSEVRIKMTDKIKGFVSYKQFVEYFCRIDIAEDPEGKLPQDVCNLCYQTLLSFCKFTISVEKHQNLIINRLPTRSQTSTTNESTSSNHDNSSKTLQKRKRHESSSSESSRSSHKDTQKQRDSSSCSSSSDRRKKQKSEKYELKTDKSNEKQNGIIESESGTLRNCLTEVLTLFKNELSEREKTYEKITIKDKLLLEGGEIPKNWLSRYNNFVTWQDLVHVCQHCDKKFSTFDSLLKHFESINLSTSKRSFKCAQCDAIFKESRALATYINHIDKQHYPHLKFGCIFCDKIFVNVVKLCQHGIAAHGDVKIKFKFYPCFDCGLVCSTIDTLVQHKSCHDV